VPLKSQPALETVRSFVNTRDVEAGTDELIAGADLSRWALAAGITSSRSRFTTDDLERALTLREGLRVLLARNNGERDPADDGALDALDRVTATVPMQSVFHNGAPVGWAPVGARPIDRVFGHLLAAVQTAAVSGEWIRLKACREKGCRWAFYDSSKNRSGTWCSMAVCGNAAKQRAYAARRRSGRSARA
jgi:predicted RNA-binding Zn ribbon-like protein